MFLLNSLSGAWRFLLISILSFVFLIQCAITTVAVPAYPHPVEYKLPDGSILSILLKGDEKVRWAQTLDGYTILMNSQGYYEYAILDNANRLVYSGVRATESTFRTSEESQFLSTLKKGLYFSPEQIALKKQAWEIYEKEAALAKSFPTTGDRKLLCILMGYADLPFSETQATFTALFNEIGYTIGGATGSVKDLYLENSYGAFNLTVDVVGPYSASQNMVYYGGNSAFGGDSNPRALAAEAVTLANPFVDYADYDNDNDGFVDGVYIIFAGYGEEAGGNADAIWSHAWNLSPTLYFDGKSISKYSCSPEYRGNSGSNLTRIGVICHEFGHVLGAPDYYDTDYADGGQYPGTGLWDLMASGVWNNEGATPAHHNGFTKTVVYNWATAHELSDPTTITLYNAAENSNSFYKLNTSTPNEYFFFENREKHLFDAAIPASGMISYHVHSGVLNIGNSINATHPQRMYVVCANAGTDPTSNPTSYGSVNSGGAPFPGSSMITSFTDLTLPSTKSWAGVNTEKPITNIVRNAEEKTVSFDFMGGASGNPTAFKATAVSASQIDLSWNKNEDKDVILAFSDNPSIGDLEEGMDYSPGQQLADGGTIIYAGNQSSFSIDDLAANTRYYFKIWSQISDTPSWSSGVETSAKTLCNSIITLPYVEDFSVNSVPMCWSVTDHKGNGQVWQFGTISSGLAGGSGNYAYINSDAYGMGSEQNTDLVTPIFNLTNFTEISISFKHYFKSWSSSKGQFFYSIDGGNSWTLVQQWTGSTTSNPQSFELDILALANESQVQFKWNYTGSWAYFWCVDDFMLTGTSNSPLHTLALEASPVDAATLEGMGSYMQGQSIQVNAIALDGFVFRNWMQGAVEISTVPLFQFTMPNEDVALLANFDVVAPPFHTLTINLEGQGLVLVNGSPYVNAVELEEGTAVQLEALPGEGYIFEGWQGDITNESPSIDFTLEADMIISAHFNRNTHSELSALTFASLSPNPFLQHLQLGNAQGVKCISFVNLLGQEVARFETGGADQLTIGTALLPSGAYMIVLEGYNNERDVRKLFKE